MKKSNKTILWSIVSTLLLAVILCAILTNGFLEWNRYCVFGHEYGEDSKCIRCGKDKPIENEPEVGPQAFISEPYRMSAASANLLMAAQSNSNLPTGYRAVQVGDVIYDANVNYYFDRTKLAAHVDCTETKKILTLDNGRTLYLGASNPDSFYGFYFDELDVECGQEPEDYYYVEFEPEEQGGELEQFLSFRGSQFAQLNLTGKVTAIHLNDVIFVNPTLVVEVPANPSKTGYTFTGWYTDEACTNKYTDQYVTSDITLYAGFRAHTYSIKFNANSGSGTMANETMTYDQAKALTANSFTKDHYAFKGWATSANGAVVHTDKKSIKNLTATDGAVIELFAVWKRSEVSVTFVSEGNTVATTWIAIGTAATLPETPTKDGHTFIGWYMADGTKYETQNISEDTTLTARFEIIRCTVTFIVDGEVYATYVCDWGTSLADALNANDINPALLQTEDEYSRNF